MLAKVQHQQSLLLESFSMKNVIVAHLGRLVTSHLMLLVFAATVQAQSATRNPSYWPFSSDSPWNVSIGSNATTATITSEKFSSSGGAYLNVTEWGYPVFVGASSDPLLNFYDSDGDQLIASGHCPSGAAPDPSDDGSLIIINGGEAVECGAPCAW